MKINKRVDGDYEQVAKVTASGEVEGESSTAQRLKNELDGEGVFVPGLDDDRENCFVHEGPDLLIYLENKYSNGHYSASLEDEDFEDMAEMSDSSLFEE
jgi:hypothetical protein